MNFSLTGMSNCNKGCIAEATFNEQVKEICKEASIGRPMTYFAVALIMDLIEPWVIKYYLKKFDPHKNIFNIKMFNNNFTMQHKDIIFAYSTFKSLMITVGMIYLYFGMGAYT